MNILELSQKCGHVIPNSRNFVCWFSFLQQRKAQKTRAEGNNLFKLKKWWLPRKDEKYLDFCQVISIFQANFTWKCGRVAGSVRVTGTRTGVSCDASGHRHHANPAPLPATALNWQNQCVLSFCGCFLWGCGFLTVISFFPDNTKKGESSKHGRFKFSYPLF